MVLIGNMYCINIAGMKAWHEGFMRGNSEGVVLRRGGRGRGAARAWGSMQRAGFRGFATRPKTLDLPR